MTNFVRDIKLGEDKSKEKQKFVDPAPFKVSLGQI